MEDEKLWFTNLEILFNKNDLFEIVPQNMSFNRKINTITRFSIYFSLLLYILTLNYKYFYLVFIVMSVSYLLYVFNIENFESYENHEDNENNLVNQDNKNNGNKEKPCKEPTPEKITMNLLVSDDLNKNNKSCKIDKKRNNEINKLLSEKIIGSTNIYNNSLFDRTFYTMPNNKVPNRPFSFWLNGVMKHLYRVIIMNMVN